MRAYPTELSWNREKKANRTKHFIRYSACSSTFSPLVRVGYAIMFWSQRQKRQRVRSIFYFGFVFFFVLSSISPSHEHTHTHIGTATYELNDSKRSIYRGRPSIRKIANTLCKTSTFSDTNYPSYLSILLHQNNFYLLFWVYESSSGIHRGCVACLFNYQN